MSFLGNALKSLFIGPLLGAGLGLLKGKKKPPAGTPIQATRDDAARMVERDQELARRRGAAADIITGTTGAEAAAGSIGRLVVGS
ncbi:MAG: hypothetical protein B7Y36_08275 [Novosphingobium sp. 28-62-57]|uniref:hypothetical protein n=1 Tax=unclassified Novosphingobium TaxID=2644732 RepID=UPI000BCF2775|nr:MULTISPECIES: hypothetical protein [unclassified Novosphingobium]OYW47921.1 MAG: hypothetical protein B7Z36_01370 [Novosphingobium sp. 12-63-9]OYZ10812.1 MAG: hypothetical protein B7Y36_08275 [Novosphingobium sp. 28-62-57]OZA36952.1 MAG: hypothetical protein B7X92_05410 [Novosphingobium sp. 17-62-9]HQS69733.1 hypothetical protein [Novosphingobium sp.]